MARKVLMCLPGTEERKYVPESSYEQKDLRELGWTECLTTHVHPAPPEVIPYGMSPWENDHPE